MPMVSAPSLPPMIASRYVPVRLIAQGGMGAVYEVEHVRTGEHLALKVLLSHVGAAPAAIERFKREARASARIKSEHVVRVIDADVAPELDGAPFLVMELLEGMDLERAALSSAPSQETVVGWLRQVARAIDKAHRLGIVHRDLKPENLFLATVEDHPPVVKVLDFGIVKMTEEGTGATGSGVIVGTPKYMAPEQASAGGRVTPAADRYALGLVAYRLLSGESYFEGDLMGILADLVHGRLEPPSKRHPGFSAGFDAWFLKACARDPAQRFSSAAEQVESLSAALGLPTVAIETTREPPAPIGQGVSRKLVVALVAGGLVVVSVATAAFVRSRSAQPGKQATTSSASVVSPPTTSIPPMRSPPPAPGIATTSVGAAALGVTAPPAPASSVPGDPPAEAGSRVAPKKTAARRATRKAPAAEVVTPTEPAAKKPESPPAVDPYSDQK